MVIKTIYVSLAALYRVGADGNTCGQGTRKNRKLIWSDRSNNIIDNRYRKSVFVYHCLASHTLQSQEKEGLATIRKATCSVGMQITKTSRVTANNTRPTVLRARRQESVAKQ